jgi:hypothetical protein
MATTNLPNSPITKTTTASVIQFIDAYSTNPINLDANDVVSLEQFFTSKGFDITAAQNVAYQILVAAKATSYNVQQIIDSLRPYDKIQLNDFLINLINYNRSKSSSLGTIVPFTTAEHVQRNILV